MIGSDEARERGLGPARGLVFVFLFYISLGLVALATWIAWRVFS